MKKYNRNRVWRSIWDNKYKSCQKQVLPHIMAGYDCLSENQFRQMVLKFLPHLDLKKEHDFLDTGCGCGAFSQHINTFKSLTGIDYSPDAIRQIHQLLNGNFYVAECGYLPFQPTSFDRVISFGTFIYFNSQEYVLQTLSEMERVTRKGGIIFIGELNDYDKKSEYIRLRHDSNHAKNQIVKNVCVDHLFFKKAMFIDFANSNHLKITIIDETDLDIPFYINAHYRFSVIMKK